MKQSNTQNLSDSLRKMQEDAVKQAKDFKSKSANKENIQNSLENKLNSLAHKSSFLDSIDKDNALIIILIVLLMDDERNFTLILILISLLI